MSSTDLSSNPSEPHAGDNRNGDSGSMAMIVYILYLVGLISGVTSIVGVIIAYIYQPQAQGWLKDHYRYQIRTFWIGFLYSFVSFLLLAVVVGWLLLVLTVVWLIVRSIKGIQALQNKSAPANIEGWLF